MNRLLRNIFLIRLVFWGILTPPGLLFAQESEHLSPPWVDFLPYIVGTETVFRDNENNYQRRVVDKIALVDIPALEMTAVPFAEVSVFTGPQEGLTHEKFSRNTVTFSRSETQYILLTPDGYLRSEQLGEGAEEFFPDALFILQDPQKKEWQGISSGSNIHFQVEGEKKVRVLSQEYDDCLFLTYQIGLETEGKGNVYYCRGIGETKIEEAGYQLELIHKYPSKQKNPQRLEMANFTAQQMKWIYQNLPSQIVVAPNMTLIAPKAKISSGFWLLWGFLVILVIGGIAGFFYWRYRSKTPPADPKIFQEELALGISEFAQGKWVEARTRLEGLLPSYSRQPDLHFQLGQVFEKTQDLEKAKNSFVKAVRLNPKLVDAHIQLGKIFRDQANYKEAYESYRLVLGLRPKWAEIHNAAGEVMRAMGDEPKAREHFELALAINPHFDLARRNLQVG